jgi:hypothetical protein
MVHVSQIELVPSGFLQNLRERDAGLAINSAPEYAVAKHSFSEMKYSPSNLACRRPSAESES